VRVPICALWERKKRSIQFLREEIRENEAKEQGGQGQFCQFTQLEIEKEKKSDLNCEIILF
jgi:hypothetical protein